MDADDATGLEPDAEADAEVEAAGEPVDGAPDEVEMLEQEPDIAQGSRSTGGSELDEELERAEMDAEGEGDSQSLARNFLEDATATDNDDQPVSVDAPDAREPELDRWEEKEKP